jgi:hypothetical protein
MLKTISPSERMFEVGKHLKSVMAVGALGIYVGDFVLLLQRREDPGYFWFLVFGFASMIVAGNITHVVWIFVFTWLARTPLRSTAGALFAPDTNPKSVTKFLEAWWRNEFVLDAFFVALMVTIGVSCFWIFGPMLGIL